MALEGTLQDMSLSDLVQVFKMGPKTGVLLLAAGEERGVIYVAEGKLIDAAIVRGNERVLLHAHDDAVIQMMLWDDANFIFRHDPSVVERPARVKHDGEWLVMEGMKRRDDPLSALPYHSISLDTRLQLSPLPSGAETGVSLDVNQWRILSQVSSCPDLRAISEVTGIAPAQVIRTVAELLAVGMVEVVVPAAPKPRPRPAPSAESAPAPVFAGVGASNGTEARSTQVGRGLLDAIMRRVRGL